MNFVSSSGNFVVIAGTGLDRLLKQRFALRLRILSGGAVFLATKILS